MKDNIITWMTDAIEEFEPVAPVLEVGAININGSVRPLFPEPYTGFDLRAGEGVDVVGDVLTHHFAEEFNTIVCCETLEHVTTPWKAVERMGKWLRPGGLMFLSGPFMHFIHDHPGDYWRFTDQGFRVLFEEAGLRPLKLGMDMSTTFGVATK